MTKVYVSHSSLDLDEVNVKFAAEIGYMVMYNKPMVVVIAPGMKVPKKLAAVIDEFVEMGGFCSPQQEEDFESSDDMVKITMPDESEFGPDWDKYVDHVREELVPKVRDSSVFVSLVPEDGEADGKFAVELGVGILFDKPIIAVYKPGTPLSDKFKKIVDRFVECDMSDPNDGQKKLMEALTEMCGDIDE